MASRPESTFNKAVERFRDSLTEDQKREFSATSLEDVKSEIQNIQHRLGLEKKLRNLNKVSRFLEAMKQVEQVVNVFLNVHEIVAFIWGPIKLALVVAGTRIDILERLLDTYVEIGEVIPGLQQYDQLFKNCPAVREILEWYLYDILQFHRKALDVFARPAWETALRSAWKTFETSFKPILDSLKRHRTLLSDEKLTAAIAEIQDVRQLAVTRFNEQSAQSNTRFDELSKKLHNIFQELSKQLYENQEKTAERETREQQQALRQQRHFIANKLGPPDYEADQHRASEQRFSGSGDWILTDPDFLSWLDPRNPSHSTLYLHGMPGAGKTTLVSRVVDHLRSEATTTKTPLLFFYFKHHEETKNSMGGMLRALLVQLLYQDDTLIEYFYQKCCSTITSELRTLSVLKELAQESLKSQHHCLIVLDGLDECVSGQNTRHEGLKGIIDWFQNSVIPDSRSEGGCIQLLLAGQRDGVLDQHLSALPGIKLDTIDAHLRDIWDYAVSRVSEIRERFPLSHDMQAQITSKVTAASKGMFLYAKVVLDNLMGQGSEAELENELKTENFPDGLDSAYGSFHSLVDVPKLKEVDRYERVVVRVLERPTRSKREAAARILGWITCAARPLRWSEIQSRFCINFEQGCCNFKNRRVDSCKVLCGSLVEAEQCNWGAGSGIDIIISLVHDTAATYLIHTGRIRLFEEHTEMAVFCCRYLTSGPFKLGVQERSIRDFALSGYYGFQDYAGAYWHHHVDSVLNLAADLPVQLSEDIARSVFCLLGDYEMTQQTGSTAPGSQPVPAAQQARKILQEWRDNAGEQKRLTFLGRSLYPSLKDYVQAAVVSGAVEILKDLLSWYNQNSGAAADTSLHAAGGWVDTGNALDKTLLHIAAANEDAAILKVLLTISEVNPDLKNISGETPLHIAAQGGHQAVVNVLLATGRVDPNSENNSGDTPIHCAVRGGHQAVVNVLLATGRVEGETLLHSAANEGQKEIVNILLATGKVDPDSKNESDDTPLHDAAFKGHEAIVNALLATGKVDPNSKNESGDTPLHCAASVGHEAIVNILLATGKLDPYSNDKYGDTPLHYAAYKGHGAIVNIVLAPGKVDPDSKNESDDTPLHSAAIKGHEAIVNALLATGELDPDSKNKYDDTPLHCAAKKGHEAIVNALLATGKVDPNSKNKFRDTPLRIAVEGGHNAIASILDSCDFANPYVHRLPPHQRKFADDYFAIFNSHLRVLDVDLVHTLIHDSVVYDVRFSADGKCVATGCNRSAQIYDVASGEKLCVLGDDSVDQSIDNYIQSVCFSPDGKYLATGGQDKLIRVWDINSRTIRNTFSGHEQTIHSVDFARDGRTIASGSGDRTVRLWDFEIGKPLWVLSVEDAVTSVAISSDTKYVAASSLYTSLRVWNIQTGDLVEPLEDAEGHRDSVYSVAFAPNGRDLVSGSLDNTIKTWELMPPRSGIPNARPSVKGSIKTFYGHRDFVLSVAVTPDGAWAMSGSKDCGVQFWDLRTGNPQLRLQGHKNSVISVAPNPMGGSFATGSGDMRARIWRYHAIQPGVEEKTGSDW
ncbi:hypothetical protein DL768_003106 [Monosporascus sp. mg162]|nr:hypothetical protein DL768_003106 [Monosporascus sp. mg162]